MHTTLLIAHIIVGTIGLLLAGPILFAPKRRGRHTMLGRIYAVCAVVLCASAFGLWLYRPAELIGLLVLAILTFVWVAAGVWIARHKPGAAWKMWHLTLMGSSVIAFVTAFVVQIFDGHLAAWIAPSVIGTILITTRNIREGRALAARIS